MFVILQPNSNTNPSDDYRVVDYNAWSQSIGSPIPKVCEFEAFATYAEAETARDAGNASVPPVAAE